MKYLIKKVMMGFAVICLGAFAAQAQGETPVMSLAVSEMEAVVTVPADRRVPMTLRLVWGNSDAERADVATVTASGGVFRASMKDFDIPDGTKVHAELVSLYDVVEYVESHGTEYVSVGTTLAAGIKVSMDAQFTSDEGTQTAWGFSANGNCWFGCANAQYHFGQKSLVISPLYRSSTSVYYETTSRQYVLIDEFSYDQSSSASASDTLKVFASGSPPNYFTQMKLWAFTVENVARGETLVDFVPIRNDGVGALYDVVHDVVYEAQIKAGEEGGLSCGETVVPVGGCFGVSNEVDFERLCDAVASENSLAADGNPHQCSVSVLYPADGYEVKWAWSDDLAAFVHDEPESFTEVGEYRNAVRVTCEGCRPWQGESVLRILAADSHREVSARRASNDAIVISWGAHFEKMDVYIVWDEVDHPDATNLSDWPNSQLALSLTDASEPGEAEFARPDGARYVRVVTLKSHTGVGIEYLESLTSTGTQILDLGYQMTATTGVEIDISMSNGSGSNSSVPFFGAYDGASPGSAVGTQCMIWYYGSGTYRLFLTASKVDTSRQVVTSTPGERETLKIDPGKTFSIGSISKAIGANSQIPQNNLAVFGVSKAGGFNAAATQKYNPTVYEVRLYEGETLVRQFRPASVDGTATMVDVLDESRQASNVGTTTDFIRGAEIPLIGQTVERFDFGPAFSHVMATVENYAGIADGQAHAATVTVAYPSKGYTIRWAEVSDDPDYSITEPPAYSEVGMYTNLVKITAPEINPFYGECVVTIAEVDPVLASPKGLKISVLGDSWSTLSGVTKNQVIGGEATSYYYPKSGNDVDTTAEMWWKITADALGMTVDTVDAWGGSGVSMASSASTTKFGSSMLNRVEGLGDPDVIVIMPVGNDNWIHISLRGETTSQMVGDYCYDPKGWTFDSTSAATQKASSLYGYRAALACLLTRVHNRYPRARIYYAVSWSASSVNSNALKESAEEVCAHYGVPFCPMVSTAVEIDSGSHPTVAGQLKVAEYMTNLISNDFIRAAALVYEDENVKSNDAGLQRKVVNGDTVYVSTNSSKRVGIVTKRPMVLNRTLLVGGGGAGGQAVGGGGAGGAVAAGAPAAVFPAGARLTLRVGAGGDFIAAAGRETNEAKKKILQYCRGGSAADIWFNGLNGQPTTLNYGKVTLSAAGGGGGGGWGDNASYLSTVTVGQNGASGGGGTRDAAGGAATAGFGGGAGASATLSTGGAGGGGGAGSAGANAAAGASGIGGAGVTDDITGESLNYGAGGGGGGYTMQNAAVPTVSAGAAGGTSAGAGSAGATYGFAGKDGFGGGGGGGGYGFETGDATAFGYVGGKGGDGSVSLRFSMNFDQVVASVEDYVGIVDGQAHAATVTVAYPESDYEILWAEVSDNPNYSITEPPAYSEIGSYTNLVKITVPDLDPFYGECVVEILPNMAIGADAYVQNGLIAQWDGIENDGTGTHSSSAATWTDLVGKRTVTRVDTNDGGSWGENCFVESSSGSSAFWVEDSTLKDAIVAGKVTVEIFCEHASGASGYEDWFGFGKDSSSRWLKLDIRTGDAKQGQQVFQGLQYRATGWNAGALIPGNTVFNWGAPQYAAVVCEGTTATLYGNGAQIVHAVSYGTSTPTDGVFTFGGFCKGTSGYPLQNAKIYAIRIYDRALTPLEVALNVAVDKIRFSGANPEDVLPQGYHWNPQTGKVEVLPGVPIGVNETLTVGEDTVYVFSTVGKEVGMVTLTDPTRVDILVVGGGGGGGSVNGGGGGGGGVVYLQDQVLSAGTYTIDVGAGGAKPAGYGGKNADCHGGDGGDSSFGAWIARGGGGGGYWQNGAGNAGGCGGGGNGSGAGGASNQDSYDGAGHGTAGVKSGSIDYGGGGGGAGTAANGMTGGDGYPCFITGANLYYGAGGGAGQGAQGNSTAYPGGLGGGGTGGKTVGGNVSATAGSFYGAGGGGGRGSTVAESCGAAGYQGVVIVRVKQGDTPEPPEPPVGPTVVTVTPNANQAKAVGNDDPELTYTLSPEIAVTGALAREAGEEVGTYAINLGTLKAINESTYTLVLAAETVYFSITNAVTPPTPPEPPIEPTGDVAVESADGSITVTVDAGTVTESTPVYLVWDTTDKSDDFSAWANSAKIGDVDAEGDTFELIGSEYGIPDGAAIRVFVGIFTPDITLYDSLVKAKTVNAVIDTGYCPNKTTTSGFDLDVCFANLSTSSDAPILGVQETSAAANESSGQSKENVTVNFGGGSDNYWQFFTWPHIYHHKDFTTSQTYRILNANTATVTTRGVLKLRTGATPDWTRDSAVVTTGTAPWPEHLTYDYAAGSTVAVFGRKNITADGATYKALDSANMTLYGFKVYESDAVAADFVPASAEGTAGLYDLKSGEFRAASASGITFGTTTNTIPSVTVLKGVSAAATYDEVELFTHEPGSTDWTVVVCTYDAIIAAVNACHEEGGGRIVVPAGTYPNCRTIRLYSNQELHLEAGATIIGSTMSDDYTDVPETVFELPIESSRKVFITAYNEDCSRLENIKLTGEGTIDGQGPAFFPNQTGTLWPKQGCPARPLMVRIFRCDGLEITGLTFKDCPVWTMQIRECSDFFVEDITINNNQHMINSDGIDVDGCQNVMIRNSSFTTGDDCIIMRAITYDTSKPVITENVVVSNCVLNSACQVIRMGCPSDDTIRHIYMKDIVVAGRNGINFDYPTTYIRGDIDGYMDITDCVFENFRGSLSECAINISVTTTAAQDALRRVDGVTFRNCSLSSNKSLNFTGRVDSPVCNVTLENCAFNNCGYTAKYAPGFKMVNTTFNDIVPAAWQPYEGEEYPFLRLPGTSTATSGSAPGSGVMTGRTYEDSISNAFTVGFCVRNPSAKGLRDWNSDRCGYIAGNGTYDNALGGFAVAFIEKCTDSTGATAVGARLALRVAESSNTDMAEMTLIGSDENRTDAAALLDGDWHRVYVTYDATAEKAACYIDGECVKEIAGSDLAAWYQALGTRPFSIGRHPAGTGFNFAGDLSQVALFDRALTAAEVAAIDAPLSGTEADLVGYWPLDEGAMSFVGDCRAALDGANNGSIGNGADNTNAYWAYDEEPILVPEIEPTMYFDAEVTDYSGNYDGIAHACTLTVTDPAAGYKQKWAWQGESDFTHATPQSCTAIGSYTNVVRLTAPGYFDFYGTGVVEIAEAPAPEPVEPHQGGTYLTFPKIGSTATNAKGNGVVIGSKFADADQFSVSALVKNPQGESLRSNVPYGVIASTGAFSTDTGMCLYYVEDDPVTIYFQVRSASSAFVQGSTQVDMADGKWHHVAATYDKTALEICIYIDGVKKDVTYASGATWGTCKHAHPLSIGRHSVSPYTYNFVGSISDVAYFDKVLTPVEVGAQLSGLTGTEDGLVGWWPMDEGEGTTVRDAKGSNNGTIRTNTDAATDQYWEIDEPAPIPMTVTVTDAKGITYDGEAHYATVTVTDPATGATITWDNGATGGTGPAYTDAGSYTNVFTVTAEGYLDFVGTGVVEIAAAPVEPGIKVGDNLTATFEDGTCTISGTGAMWDKDALDDLRALAITNLVIGEGVTAIGASAFEKMKSIHNVTIASTVTSIGAQTFHKCYNLTNVVIHTGATAPAVGEYAFFRCNSLVRITVTGGSTVDWGENAFTLQAGIFMNSDTGLPEIYPIPEIIDDSGYSAVLYGTNDLNGNWTKITSSADRANYHFFKIVIE